MPNLETGQSLAASVRTLGLEPLLGFADDLAQPLVSVPQHPLVLSFCPAPQSPAAIVSVCVCMCL